MTRVTSDSPPVDPAGLLPPFAPRSDAERWLFSLQRLGIRPGLTTIRALLEAMERPESRFPSVVVAGTNGKGSVTAFLEQLARASGLRTGLYTSPHLLRLNERIRVEGVPIAEDELARRVFEHRRLVEAEEATFFEALTAIALEYFAERSVDVAFLEVGLGGRLDATNAARKIAVVLTSVALDHQHLLGDSVEAIAREKLSLCEPGLPVYLAHLDEGLREFALGEIAERGASAIDPPPAPPDSWRVSSLGHVQRRQAAFAASVHADLAGRMGWPAPGNAAPAELGIPARYQLAGSAPRLIVDPAHNEEAVAALLDQWGAEPGSGRSVLVFGQMEEKRIDGLYPRFHDLAHEIVLTAPRWPRAMPAAELARRLVSSGKSTLHVRPEVGEALACARELAGDDGRVLLFGSNFLVAEALDRLGFDDLDALGPSAVWDRGLAFRSGTGREDSP